MKDSEQAASQRIWSGHSLWWPYAIGQSVLDSCFWWLDHAFEHADHSNDAALPWTTPNKVLLELPAMRLRDFSRRETCQPVLICAPYALHRALIADFAAHHSIVEALQWAGLDPFYLTDWRSASPEMRFWSIDDCLEDLNVAVDEIGTPIDLVGLCQGGWLSLLYAARFPKKVRRLVLVGAPVDVSVESALSWAAANAPQSSLEVLVDSGGGLIRGHHMLHLWNGSADPEAALQIRLSRDIAADRELLDRFKRWNSETLDLPGTFFLQVVRSIFRENRLARGSFMALGREIRLQRVEAPVFLLVGVDDEIVPAEQAMATASLLGAGAASVESTIVPSDHLGLFIGGRTLANWWPRVAAWLQVSEPVLRSRKAALA